MDVGGRRKTRSAEGGTRHALFAGVRPGTFSAGNSAVLFVACYCLSLKFAGVAVRVAVQRLLVQQYLGNEWKQES